MITVLESAYFIIIFFFFQWSVHRNFVSRTSATVWSDVLGEVHACFGRNKNPNRNARSTHGRAVTIKSLVKFTQF